MRSSRENLTDAAGHSAVKRERDQLEGAVQAKLALWRAARCGFDRKA